MKDFLGREFKIGDQVVYPQRYSSNLWMNFGVVTGFGEKTEYGRTYPTLKIRVYKASRWDKTPRDTELRVLDRVTILTQKDPTPVSEASS